MNLVQRALDATLGKALEWAGRHWFSGRSESDRLRTVYRDLSAAMAECVAVSANVGVAIMSEYKFVADGSRAELRVGTLSAEIADAELVETIRTFRDAAAITFGRRTRDADWLAAKASLRTDFDRASDRIRILGGNL